jgi:site-specific recombinase XerD
MKLTTCLNQFFGNYLPHIKGVSQHTIKAYRDAFTLFIPFAANRLKIKTGSLMLDHLTADMVLAFLVDLEHKRHNTPVTRNHRLAALKSLAKMIRFMHPEKKDIAEKILAIPQKRCQRKLIGFLYPNEIFKTIHAVDLNKKQGFRDYCLLVLLYDSGARASEIATLNLDYFNSEKTTLAILGKANRYRQLTLMPETTILIKNYIDKYRQKPKPAYRHRLFINQRGKEMTRHGIYRVCKKYLNAALPPKRLKNINPVHSFRHSCAVNMLTSGCSPSDIRIQLGHEDLQATSVYLQLDLSHKRKVLNKFVEFNQSVLIDHPQIQELINTDNKEDIMAWLDSL